MSKHNTPTRRAPTMFHGTLLTRGPEGEIRAYAFSHFGFEAFNAEMRACRERAQRTGTVLEAFSGWCTCENEYGSLVYCSSELMDPDLFRATA